MTIAIDFDGTVANTMPGLEDLAVRLAMIHTGKDDKYVQGWYRATAGLPFSEQVDVLGTYPALVREFEDRKVGVTLMSPPFEDVYELAGIPEDLVLVSSTTTLLVGLYLGRWRLDCLFQGVVGWSRGHSKTQQILDCDARVFIGDTDQDAKYAAWAGVEFWPVRRSHRYLHQAHTYADLDELVNDNWTTMREGT